MKQPVDDAGAGASLAAAPVEFLSIMCFPALSAAISSAVQASAISGRMAVGAGGVADQEEG